MYDGKEVAIGAGGISAAECARLQGNVVDGGQRERVTSVLFRENLTGASWGVAVDGTRLTQADFGATLLSFPMCEMHRRFGRSDLVRSLDRLDSQYSTQLLSVLSDSNLRRRVFELIVDIATLSASAIAHEGDDAYGVPVSGELLARGRALGEEIQQQTSDEDLKNAVAEAVRISESLQGVSLSGLLPSLHSAHRA